MQILALGLLCVLAGVGGRVGAGGDPVPGSRPNIVVILGALKTARPLDEAPEKSSSFSPNGTMLILGNPGPRARSIRRGVEPKAAQGTGFPAPEGDVREPAGPPYMDPCALLVAFPEGIDVRR